MTQEVKNSADAKQPSHMGDDQRRPEIDRMVKIKNEGFAGSNVLLFRKVVRRGPDPGHR